MKAQTFMKNFIFLNSNVSNIVKVTLFLNYPVLEVQYLKIKCFSTSEYHVNVNNVFMYKPNIENFTLRTYSKRLKKEKKTIDITITVF